MLEFRYARLSDIGGQAGVRNRQWATLSIGFREVEIDHAFGVEIKLLVPKRPDATMSELQEAARTEARAILAECLSLLEGSSLAELEAEEQRMEDAEEERLGLFDGS